MTHVLAQLRGIALQLIGGAGIGRKGVVTI